MGRSFSFARAYGRVFEGLLVAGPPGAGVVGGGTDDHAFRAGRERRGAAAAPRARVARLAPRRGAYPQQRALAPDRHPRGLGRDVPRRAALLRPQADAPLARRHGLAAARRRRGRGDRGGGPRAVSRPPAEDVLLQGMTRLVSAPRALVA